MPAYRAYCADHAGEDKRVLRLRPIYMKMWMFALRRALSLLYDFSFCSVTVEYICNNIYIFSNAHESATVTAHVTGINPAFDDERVYDCIIEEGGKPVVVDTWYANITNRQYEPPVLPVGDNRSEPIYHNTRPTPPVYNIPTYCNETGMEQYRNDVSPSNVTGIGETIAVGSDTYSNI